MAKVIFTIQDEDDGTVSVFCSGDTKPTNEKYTDAQRLAGDLLDKSEELLGIENGQKTN